MIGLDGTRTKSKLGATPSSASRSPRQGRAAALGMPLYKYIGGPNAKVLPVPMITS